MNSDAFTSFTLWYESLKKYGSALPAKGTIAGCLVVLERLKDSPILDIEEHTAPGGSQIMGASGEAVRRLLASFGETREFVSEGGRTNRGLRGDVKGLLDTLASSDIQRLSENDRIEVLNAMQGFLVERVQEFHNRQRIRVTYDPSQSLSQCIRKLLDEARETNKEGPVAQYLIGAKLQLRFPGISIGNESYSVADEQLGRAGDFLVKDTAFHVTVAPMPAVYLKCKRNISEGLRACLIVPERTLVGAKQNADLMCPGQIEVIAIEAFVAQNIGELSEFSIGESKTQLKLLLELYNERVDATERDKSMMVDIPRNLLGA